MSFNSFDEALDDEVSAPADPQQVKPAASFEDALDQEAAMPTGPGKPGMAAAPRTPPPADSFDRALDAAAAGQPVPAGRRTLKGSYGPAAPPALNRAAEGGDLTADELATIARAPATVGQMGAPTVTPAPVPKPDLFEPPELNPITGKPMPTAAEAAERTAHPWRAGLHDTAEYYGTVNPVTRGAVQVGKGLTEFGALALHGGHVVNPTVYGAHAPAAPGAATPGQAADTQQVIEQLAAAGSDVLEGGLDMLTPVMVAAGVAAPLETAGVLVTAHLAGKGGQAGTAAAGGGPQAQRFVGNLASIIAGAAAAGAAKSIGSSAAADPQVAARRAAAATLGVDPAADPATIKAAYRAAAQANHPDVGGDVETMADINLAYRWLVDHPDDGHTTTWGDWVKQQGDWLRSKFSSGGADAGAVPGEEAPPAAPQPAPMRTTPADQRLLAPAHVDEAGRDLGGYAGPERRQTDAGPPPDVEERRLPAEQQVREDLKNNPDLIRQADEMRRRADNARHEVPKTFEDHLEQEVTRATDTGEQPIDNQPEHPGDAGERLPAETGGSGESEHGAPAPEPGPAPPARPEAGPIHGEDAVEKPDVVEPKLPAGVTYFRSGATRPADFEGFSKAKVPVGVTATELSAGMVDRVIKHVKDGGQLFVDSGAFGGTPDFAHVLGTYTTIARKVGPKGVDRLYVVAPDVVGDQAATQALQDKHSDALNTLAELGANVVFPVQKGAGSLADQIRAVNKEWGGAVIGIPFNKAAFSIEEVTGALQELEQRDAVPEAIHLLGIGERNKAFAGAVEQIRAASPGLRISSDSNRVAALFGKGRPAQETMEGKVETRAPERVDVDADKDTTELTGALWRGELDTFSEAELAQIGKALPYTGGVNGLRFMARNNEKLRGVLDANEQQLDLVLHRIALARAKKTERPIARTETITEHETAPKKPDVVAPKARAGEPEVGQHYQVGDRVGLVKGIVDAGKKGGTGANRPRRRAQMLFTENGRSYEQFVDLTEIGASVESQRVEKPVDAVEKPEVVQPKATPTQPAAPTENATAAQAYLSKEFNYGGTMTSRGAIIQDLEARHIDREAIDRYMQGLEAGENVQPPHAVEDDESVAAYRYLLENTTGRWDVEASRNLVQAAADAFTRFPAFMRDSVDTATLERLATDIDDVLDDPEAGGLDPNDGVDVGTIEDIEKFRATVARELLRRAGQGELFPEPVTTPTVPPSITNLIARKEAEIRAAGEAPTSAPAAAGLWLPSLDAAAQDRVWHVLRDVSAVADAKGDLAQKLAPRNGEIAVGSEHVRADLEADSRRAFVRAISQGDSPAEAAKKAIEVGALWAKNWNAKRRDYQVHIDKGAAESFIQDAMRAVTAAASGAKPSPVEPKAAPPAPPKKPDIVQQREAAEDEILDRDGGYEELATLIPEGRTREAVGTRTFAIRRELVPDTYSVRDDRGKRLWIAYERQGPTGRWHEMTGNYHPRERLLDHLVKELDRSSGRMTIDVPAKSALQAKWLKHLGDARRAGDLSKTRDLMNGSLATLSYQAQKDYADQVRGELEQLVKQLPAGVKGTARINLHGQFYDLPAEAEARLYGEGELALHRQMTPKYEEETAPTGPQKGKAKATPAKERKIVGFEVVRGGWTVTHNATGLAGVAGVPKDQARMALAVLLEHVPVKEWKRLRYGKDESTDKVPEVAREVIKPAFEAMKPIRGGDINPQLVGRERLTTALGSAEKPIALTEHAEGYRKKGGEWLVRPVTEPAGQVPYEENKMNREALDYHTDPKRVPAEELERRRAAEKQEAEEAEKREKAKSRPTAPFQATRPEGPYREVRDAPGGKIQYQAIEPRHTTPHFWIFKDAGASGTVSTPFRVGHRGTGLLLGSFRTLGIAKFVVDEVESGRLGNDPKLLEFTDAAKPPPGAIKNIGPFVMEVNAGRLGPDAERRKGGPAASIALDDSAPAPERSRTAGGPVFYSSIVPGAEQLLEKDVIPALKAVGAELANQAGGMRSWLAPDTLSPAAEAIAGSIAANRAAFAHDIGRLKTNLHRFEVLLDKIPYGTPDDAPAAGTRLALAMAIDEARVDELPAHLREAAKAFLDIDTAWVPYVQARGGFRYGFVRDYYPRVFKKPGSVRRFIERYLFRKRPFKGTQKWRKQRTRDEATGRPFTLRQLLKRGFELAEENPVRAYLQHWDDAHKWTTWHDIIRREGPEQGFAKYVPSGLSAPEGWVRYPDSVGLVWGRPVVEVQEGRDKGFFNALQHFALGLGIPLARTVKQPKGGPRGAWGLAFQPMGKHAKTGGAIWTKFGGTEGVLAHEIGHILDFRYGLGQKLGFALNEERVEEKNFGERSRALRELHDLAALRYENEPADPAYIRYAQTRAEQIANLVHAFIYIPERTRAMAPNAYWALYNLAKETPTLTRLIALQGARSVKLGVDTAEIETNPQIAGNYWGPREAVRLMENHLAPGLRGKPGFDAIRMFGNGIVQVKLGLSAFHLVGTALNSLISRSTLATMELSRGELGAAAKTAAPLLLGPLEPFYNIFRTWKDYNKFIQDDAHAQMFASVTDQLIQGGWRSGWDTFWQGEQLQKWLATWRNAAAEAQSGNLAGAAARGLAGIARTLPALIEAQAYPVMKEWVPRLKFAAYLDAYRMEARDLGAAPQLSEVRRAARKAMESIENRFGQLVYENLFWPAWTKDLALVIFQAPGWGLGDVRELLGAVPAQLRQFGALPEPGTGQFQPVMRTRHVGYDKDPVTGGDIPKYETKRAPWLTHKFAYLVNLLVWSAGFGAIYQFLHTGLLPGEQVDGSIDPQMIGPDLYFPRRTREAGAWNDRTSLPTYIKDIYHFASDPVGTVKGKIHPIWAIVAELLKDEDYWGTEIYDKEDPLAQKVQDILDYVAKQMIPISFQSAGRLQAQGASRAQRMESFFGFTPAPAAVTRTPLEKYLHDVAPPTHRTKAQAEAAAARRDIRQATKASPIEGKAAAREAFEAQTLTPRQLLATMKGARKSGIQYGFGSLPLQQAIHAYEVANLEERAELYGALRTKAVNAGFVPDKKRLQLALALPRAKPSAIPSAR